MIVCCVFILPSPKNIKSTANSKKMRSLAKTPSPLQRTLHAVTLQLPRLAATEAPFPPPLCFWRLKRGDMLWSQHQHPTTIWETNWIRSTATWSNLNKLSGARYHSGKAFTGLGAPAPTLVSKPWGCSKHLTCSSLSTPKFSSPCCVRCTSCTPSTPACQRARPKNGAGCTAESLLWNQNKSSARGFDMPEQIHLRMEGANIGPTTPQHLRLSTGQLSPSSYANATSKWVLHERSACSHPHSMDDNQAYKALKSSVAHHRAREISVKFSMLCLVCDVSVIGSFAHGFVILKPAGKNSRKNNTPRATNHK